MAIRHLPVIRDEYVNPDLCGPCGGECCRDYPGVALPEDFGATEQEIETRLIERLGSGRWSLDFWEGDPRGISYEDPEAVSRAYFVRPATIAGQGKLIDASWGGPCTFHLGSIGCGIFDERPSGCRGLEPKPDKQCVGRYGSKDESARAWMPYAALIDRVVAHLERGE